MGWNICVDVIKARHIHWSLWWSQRRVVWKLWSRYSYMTGSSPLDLVKPKPKKRRKAVFSSRKQIRASRMRQEKQNYDSLKSTVKALEFSPDRTRSRSRIRRSQIDSIEAIGRKGAEVGTIRRAGIPKSHDLSRISETQVWPQVDFKIYALEIRDCIRELWKVIAGGINKRPFLSKSVAF